MHRGFNPSQDQRTRDKIQTTQIVNRLQALVNGEIEMSPHAVTAALGLLRKRLPDLASQELTINEQQPFALIPSELASSEAWSDRFKPKAH